GRRALQFLRYDDENLHAQEVTASMSVDGRTRDFVGYGGSPPDPKWPKGARLALNFVMNYEEGSEPSIEDGDGYTGAGLTEGASAATSAPRACSSTAAASGSGACCGSFGSATCRSRCSAARWRSSAIRWRRRRSEKPGSTSAAMAGGG